MAIARALTANPPLNLRLLNTGGPQLDREGPEPETSGEAQPRACIEACVPAVAVAVAEPPERRSRTSAPDESSAGARGVAVVGGALPPPVGAGISPAAPPAQPIQPGVVVGAERMQLTRLEGTRQPEAREAEAADQGSWRREHQVFGASAQRRGRFSRARVIPIRNAITVRVGRRGRWRTSIHSRGGLGGTRIAPVRNPIAIRIGRWRASIYGRGGLRRTQISEVREAIAICIGRRPGRGSREIA